MIDDLGRILATAEFPATRHGYRRLLAWLRSFGELVAVGVEGCGSWGAGPHDVVAGLVQPGAITPPIAPAPKIT